MNFSETVLTALTSLKVNKIRSLLTMLGIIIGVFAVLSMVSLVQGVKNFVTSEFTSLGTGLVVVAPGRISFGKDPAAAFSNNKLKESDADAIRKELSDDIAGVTPNIRVNKTITYKSKTFLSTITGVNHEFINITSAEIEKGRFFTKGEDSSGARVAVIGSQVAKTLFTEDPLGKSIKVADVSFTVIGVTKSGGFNFDERVIAPIKAVKTQLEIKQLSGLTIKVKPDTDIDEVMSKITEVLLTRHKADEFSVLSQKDILASFQNILRTLSIGLGAVAGISLIVGGIGIMNIMLVSVNERKAEIGLRKALGATPKNISTQFIIESLMLSLSGGLIGILLGYMMSFGLRTFVDASVPLWAVAISFGFSVLTGVVFGTYPAVIAGKLDPIESLRHEL